MTKIAYSVDGEMFGIEDFSEVIRELEAIAGEDSILGMEYEEAKCSEILGTDIFEFDDLIDVACDRMYDLVGECSADFGFDATTKDEFNQIINKLFLEKSNITRFYKISYVKTKKITEGDLG